MADLQTDSANPLAPVLMPYLLDLDVRRDYYRAGQDLLRDWDFDQDADSGAAAYFNVVWRNLLEHTFRDELPEELWPDGGDRWVAAVTELLSDPRNGWWDDLDTDAVVEDRDEILRRVLLDARDEMTARQALNPDEWSWGFLHRLELREPTLGDSGIGPVEWLVNRGGWEVGGGTAAVDAASWDASVEDRPYVVTSAPSMRMVVSLADLDDSRWINLTGVSGHPFHEHYTDQTDLWARGETLPWPFTADAVIDAGEHTLTLVPADGRSGRSLTASPAAVTRRSCGSTGHVEADLVVVQQHAGEGADGHPAERPVVGAAAAAEPVAGRGDGEARHQDDVGGGDRVDAQPRTGRLEQPEPARRPATRRRRTPPSRGRRRPSGPGGSTRFPAAASSRSSAPVPGSEPTETYAATVAARRTSGAASSWSAIARASLGRAPPADAGCAR